MEFNMEPTNTKIDDFKMTPDVSDANSSGTLPNGENDKEGAMAKADLYKLATYSYKLFTKIQDEDQFESWVQAKITKAADYIASVYHYLEYEMKFSEYGHQLDNSDVLSEDQKVVLKGKLMEAKAKIKELKISTAKKSCKVMPPEKDDKKQVEESAPSAGLSKEKKSEVVKKAKAGKDIGKKGKGFKEVEKAAEKSGAKDPKAVAAAAMWKNIKREAIEETQLDELGLKSLGKKSAFSKKGYKDLADRKQTQMAQADSDIVSADEADDVSGVETASKDWKSAKKIRDKALAKSEKAKYEGAENTDFSAKNVGKAAGNIWQGMKNTADAVGNTIDATKAAVSDFSKGFDAAQTPSQTSSSAKAAPQKKAVVKESVDLADIKFLSGLR